MYKIKSAAFTLAEVLITLGVIGIVAAIVIPALLANINDAELKTAWKRAFGTVNHATRLMLIDNGGSIKGTCASSDCLVNLYKTYINASTTCAAGQAGNGNCWNGAAGGTTSGMVLSNGTLVTITNLAQQCNDTTYVLQDCARIDVDVNGFKSPNTTGRDIFSIHLQPDRIMPFGTVGDGMENTCTSAGGLGCGTYYLRN